MMTPAAQPSSAPTGRGCAGFPVRRCRYIIIPIGPGMISSAVFFCSSLRAA